MSPRDLRPAGHWPTLVGAFLYFDTSFLAWVVLAALGGTLADAFRLTPGQQRVLVALPILSGALFHPVLGALADRFGPRRVALGSLALTALPLLMGWLWVDGFPQLLLVGFLLGISGAGFAVAVPLVSRWYPEEQQGLVLGLTGMGSTGTALAALLSPSAVSLVGWRGVFGLALIAVVVVFAFIALFVRDARPLSTPSRGRPELAVSGLPDLARFCVFYAVTFGGFVGLTTFLPTFYRIHYGVDPVRAGVFAALCGVSGALLRPVGGFLADRLGGVLMLFLVFLGLGVLGMRMSYLPHLSVATLCLCLMLALLGMGNGAVFQLVPQGFRHEMGIATGLVGGTGALCAFLLPLILASSHLWTRRFGPGFFLLGMLGFLAAGVLMQASRQWNVHHHPSPPPLDDPGRALRDRAALAEVALEAAPRWRRHG